MGLGQIEQFIPELKNPHIKEWNCIQTSALICLEKKGFYEEFKIKQKEHRNNFGMKKKH